MITKCPLAGRSPEQASSWRANYCAGASSAARCSIFPQPPFRSPVRGPRVPARPAMGRASHAQERLLPAWRRCSARRFRAIAAATARSTPFFGTTARQVIAFLSKFLAPYAGKWIIDFASFRPLEEDGRDLPLHKRNDLLHVDAFPSRPTRGGRILRVFTNLNPTKPRVWQITGPFESLAQAVCRRRRAQCRLPQRIQLVSRTVQDWGAKLGMRGMGRTPYDVFMLRFHDYLKENSAFQANCSKVRLEFPPHGHLDRLYRRRGARGHVRPVRAGADLS